MMFFIFIMQPTAHRRCFKEEKKGERMNEIKRNYETSKMNSTQVIEMRAGRTCVWLLARDPRQRIHLIL